jgi:hypothetical protein
MDKNMSNIIIFRTSQRINSMREYDIYVDEQKINTIGNGEQKKIEVPQGKHEIYIKIDWCKSKKLNVILIEGQELKLKCGSEIIGIKQFFALFYLFFPNKWVYLDYLSDGEVICNNENVKNWSEIKKMGTTKYILKYGIIRWGIPTGIICSVFMQFIIYKSHSVIDFLISTVICLLLFSLLGGSLFGFITWKVLKKKTINWK